MKRLILFLARISGVEKDIQFVERHNCARKIIGASYWFSDYEKYGAMYPFMYWLGKSIGHEFGVSGTAARDTYDQLTNTKLFEKWGWREISFNELIGTIEITDKNTTT